MNNDILTSYQFGDFQAGSTRNRQPNYWVLCRTTFPFCSKRKYSNRSVTLRRKPLKYFATVEIEKLAHDETWLSRATKVIYNYWAGQNQSRKTR
jgi:hypothetical protein